MDRGFFLTLQAVRRQLAAMPCDFYLVRLIHHHTRKVLPGDRLWTAPQVIYGPTVRFLRARNQEGYDVFFLPYAFRQNAGYILVDLDHADPAVLDTMRTNGHLPCVMIETSPCHYQAWIQVSAQPLQPAVASEIGKQFARLYHGDRASTDWRHLGRLAGFTNQKPKRLLPSGWPPWAKIRHATVGLAPNGASLVEAASRRVALAASVSPGPVLPDSDTPFTSSDLLPHTPTPDQATAVYQHWLNRLRIPQRFPHPDWSIADLWIASALLSHGAPPSQGENHSPPGQPSVPSPSCQP